MSPICVLLCTRVLQKVLSLGSDYFSATFYQTYFYYKPSKYFPPLPPPPPRGWSGGAKVLCILDHRGVQLILAYSWARPAILVVGKGRGGMFLFLLFLHFHSCSSFFPVPLFHLLYSLSSISFLPFSGRRHKMTLKG